jgi:ketosteroid isomerase-like protein
MNSPTFLRRLRLSGSVLLTGLLAAGVARAEIIELVDKTKLNAKIVHYYDGVFTIETSGNTVKLPREKVKSIGFQLPAPRPEFASVEKTFDRWRKALNDGDLEKMIDCYALMYQGFLASQVGGTAEGIKKMQKELEGWKFEVKGSSVKGENATLKVLRKKGEESDTGEIAFVKENGEWKMLPPQ